MSGFRAGDLPPLPGGFWQLVGPGAILVGLSIGAGELIVWPRLTAAYGASMTWVAVLGIFLQMWLNVEIGRYTLATGESAYAGYARLSSVFPWLFLALNVVGWIVPGWARACGGALKVLVVGPDGWGGPTVWTAITFLAVAAVLFGPRAIYRSVEHTVEALVVVIVLGLIGVAVSVTTGATWLELARGIANLGYKPADVPGYELFSALVFAGAGGTSNLFYGFYVRDKGWGMGAHLPAVLNPLRGRTERSGDGGFRIRDSAQNRRRWRQWMHQLVFDQVAFFWLLNTATLLLFIVGALAVLHPRGLVPDQELLVWQEAAILEASWGTSGKYVFLVVGVATLFSTQLTLIDGVARSCADILHGHFAWARRASRNEWYARIAAAWMIAGLLLTYLYEAIPPIVFLLGAGFAGGIAMAIYTPLTLLINLRHLPPNARPGVPSIVMLSTLSAVYVAFAVAASAQLVARLTG